MFGHSKTRDKSEVKASTGGLVRFVTPKYIDLYKPRFKPRFKPLYYPPAACIAASFVTCEF